MENARKLIRAETRDFTEMVTHSAFVFIAGVATMMITYALVNAHFVVDPTWVTNMTNACPNTVFNEAF